ncbi:hypothetical protein B5S31_g1151 [[Candida] boidinii]|nr:hypothetical protein B5S31_g1151 [[Candida] boidinii]
MSLNQKKYLSRTPSFFDKLSSFMLHSNISSFNSNYDINNQNTFGKFKNNEFLNYQINNKIDNYNNGSPYLYNFNQNLDNLKVVNEDLRKISESSNELSTEDDCSDNSPIVDYTLNRNTTIKNDSIEDDYYSNSDIKYQQDDVTPVDEDEFIGRVGEVSVGSFYEDADEVRRGDTNFENNYFNTNKYSAIGFKDSNEGECNYDKQQYNNKLSNSNSFPSSSFSVDNYPLENSSFQNDSPKRKRRNSISQVIDIAKNRENFQSQSKDFMRTGSLYSSSPSPLMRLKASRSTPSLSRYHSGDEKTLRSIMKKQNLMDSYSCPNTASSKMAVSFKESVQVVNYDPHDYTTGLKSPFPISVKQSPKINSIFRSPTIDRDYVSKTSPKISFKETEDRSKYLEDSNKISFKEPTKNSIVPNRKNSVTKFKNSNFSNDFTSGKSRGDNKSIDGKRNYLNVVQMDSEQDNTEININLKNTFTPSDMKSVLRVTSGGGGDSNGNNNDGAITKKNKLDTGAASAAAFYSDDSLKRLNKSTDSTNHHYHEVSEMFEENNKGNYLLVFSFSYILFL